MLSENLKTRNPAWIRVYLIVLEYIKEPNVELPRLSVSNAMAMIEE